MTPEFNPSELIALAPEIFLAVMGMFLLLASCILGNKGMLKINIAAGITLFVTMTGVIFMTSYGNTITPNYSVLLMGGHVGVDAFSNFIKIILLAASIGALLLSHQMLKTADGRAEYPVLIIFATLGMMLMVSAESLLGLYVGLELQSLTLYVLAAIQRDNARSSEAGLKYFVLGALASGLLLYGTSLIYGATGTIMFDKLATVIGKPPIEVILGFVMILSALAFKVSAAPFHMWTPDVYEGAPTPVTAFFAAAPKLAGIALLTKVLVVPFHELAFQAQQILVVLAIASMGWGALAAIAQNNIKRLMAYSSIGHVGFALLGLLQMDDLRGVDATLTYLLIYVPMTLGAFAIILSFRRDGKYLENISDLAGFSKTRPVLAAIMTLLMFSMMGIPPLAGFFGKLYVFMAAVDAGFVWLAVLGVIFSVLGGFYYLRIIKIMYFDKAEGSFDPLPGPAVGFVLTCSTLFILGFIIAPGPITAWVHEATMGLRVLS